MTVWAISKLWIDSMENRNAHGYALIGYTDDDAEARKYLSETVPGVGYPLQYVNNGNPVPKYKVVVIQRINHRSGE